MSSLGTQGGKNYYPGFFVSEPVSSIAQAIDKAYYDGKINIEDYNEMNIIIENLNSYFADMYGKYGDIEIRRFSV